MSDLELIDLWIGTRNVYEHQRNKGWYKIANKQWKRLHAIEEELIRRGITPP